MQKKIQKFTISKLGHTETQNQDAADFDQFHGIFCISDGATEGSFQREWASLLVQNFIKNPFKMDQKDADLPKWVGPIQKQWYNSLPWDTLKDQSESVIEKAENGAGATFLGFILSGKNNAKLTAWAIGDSTLFIIRNEELIKSFPMEKSADFGSVTQLIWSMSRKDIKIDGSEYFVCSSGNISSLEFELKGGDLIMAATDALAKWFFSECEVGNWPWNELRQIQGNDDFKSFVELKVENKEMRDDDVTLLVLEI